MNGRQLAEELAERLGVDPAEGRRTLEVLEEVVRDALLRGDGEVKLPGLLHLTTRVRPPRVYRNPRNGEPVERGATRLVRVRVAAQLRRAAEEAGP